MTAPRAVVLGWPVRHSRSPMIHGHWLKTYGIAGSYEHAEVPPEAFPDFVRRFEAEGIVGGNVTIPHKEAAFALVDEADPEAAALGAVNTLWRQGGKLYGANTDGLGLLANLDAGAPGWEGDRSVAVVLGAGGAGRSVVRALAGRGFDRIVVANRTALRAEAVAALAGSAGLAIGYDELWRWLPEAKLLVNSTSLGMTGKDPLDVHIGELPEDAVVNDLVYVPLETGLLAAARANGNRTVDGLGMLLHQAVPGFERWFGVRPEVTQELRALVVRDIEGR
ncbi:shikimate dehydrogenase [Chelatococcus sambhunathii]|uniref:Shikimate dehydrogenase (NADP(+)) n=1 Tax=Chelatococcus sambhunathii TaxID=363953 RepID=A0ABU1DLH6_9HYPH|nr:shikimate dehydrogenase [Chelatococcus sambhunathii]MDR4308839.1 shikimate dehydrogenase [Chelatococcus sambhunathii]